MLPQRTIAMTCDKDTLKDVYGSGAVLETISGHIYKVFDGDEMDAELWSTGDDVLICIHSITSEGQQHVYYEFLNKDEDGEEVDAWLLK